MLRYLFLLLLLTLSACATASPAPADPPPEEILYFPETGHTVQPPFSAFLQRPGKLDLLGYPITETMTEDGWTVQYFQFGRLEYHPENEPAYRVTVGWLGEWLNRTTPPAEHSLSGDFAAFYAENGGSVQFGHPISDPQQRGGKLVQDFQSARFIWAPDAPFRVKTEPIGETYFLRRYPLGLPEKIAPPPNAVIFHPEPPAIPPAEIHCAVSIESTPAENLFRVNVDLTTADGAPPVRYSPIIRYGNITVTLPPSLKNGHTHLLLMRPKDSAPVTVFAADGQTPLCRSEK